MPPTKKKTPSVNQKPIRNLDNHYTSRELSDLLNIAMSTLASYRRKGIGPKYVVLGYRSYRYSKEEVARYLEEMTRASTSATQNYDLQS